MYTLDNFYKSKEWENLIAQLKLVRLDKNGEIICEHCHRPIIKKYDCIAHHKVELTDKNVNDFSISLNPDNIALIHFKCHNQIHQRFGGFKRAVYLVYGSPCAGKAEWVNEVANADDLIVDIDRIWESICNSDRYHKPNRLKPNVFGIRDTLLEQIKQRKGMWRNAFLIGSYPLRTERDRLCDLLRAEPIFIDTPIDECLERAENDKWKEYIREWFDTYIE